MADSAQSTPIWSMLRLPVIRFEMNCRASRAYPAVLVSYFLLNM
jgi:hypothetical protein